ARPPPQTVYPDQEELRKGSGAGRVAGAGGRPLLAPPDRSGRGGTARGTRRAGSVSDRRSATAGNRRAARGRRRGGGPALRAAAAAAGTWRLLRIPAGLR